MRTRVVEVPLCDRCNSDGRLFQVIPVNGDDPFTVCRCDKHEAALRAEASTEETVKDLVLHRGNGARRRQVMALVLEHPGLAPRKYAEMLGVSSGSVTAAGRTLKEKGFIRTEGERAAVRYFPAEGVGPEATTMLGPEKKSCPVCGSEQYPQNLARHMRRHEREGVPNRGAGSPRKAAASA